MTDFPFPISQSQIECFRRCPRKYAWDYMTAGVEREQNEAAAVGSAMHEQLEAWFKDNKEPDDSLPGLMAQAIIPKWPPPCNVESVENHLHVQTEVAAYHGYQDLGYKATFVNKETGNKLHLRVVGDHKSTSDLKWAKTPDDLLTDPQAVIYSAATMAAHNVDEVIMRLVYATRNKKPKTRVVERIMTRESVEAAFDAIDATANEIYVLRAAGTPALELEPNYNGCDEKGGCEHKKRCTDLTPAKRMRALMKQQTLREKILARKAEKEGSGQLAELAPVKEEPPKTVAKPAPEATKPQTLKEKMEAKKAAAKPAPEAAPEPVKAAPKAKPKPAPKPAPEPEDELPEDELPEDLEDEELPSELPDEDLDTAAETEAFATGVTPSTAGRVGSPLKVGESLPAGNYFKVRFRDSTEGLYGPVRDESLQGQILYTLANRSDVVSATLFPIVEL